MYPRMIKRIEREIVMTINSLYGTVTSTSNNAMNLLYRAINYDSFNDSDFIIFQDGQYSYYIVWGDLEASDTRVTGSDIEYVHYYRTDSGSYNYVYSYDYGTDSSFSLALSSEYQTTSNISGVGFVSMAAVQYDYYYQASEKYMSVLDMFVLLLAFVFVLVICALRGTNK